MDVKIEASWKKELISEFEKSSFIQLRDFLIKEKKDHTVYPAGNLIFEAFNRTPFNKVKVIIIGQDPYHGTGQAHGLCFSVPKGIKTPPSLRNILKEIQADIGAQEVTHGDLSNWAEQGVLLLNATLSVRAHEAASHQKRGWEEFTDATIKRISDKKKNCVFLLWGNFAQKKADLIDSSKHCILKSVHPSPLSAHRGFFGSKHFSKTNNYLIEKGLEPINWDIN